MTINAPNLRCPPREGFSSRLGPIAGLTGILLMMLCGVGCKATTVAEYLSSGDRAMRDGKPAEAERDYQAASQLRPDDTRIHLALANLYAAEQRPALAQQEYTRVIELDPKNAAAHAALAESYAGQSQFAAAEEHCRAATAIDPTQPNYRIELGSVLAKENKLSEAEVEFRTALGLDPRNAQGHLKLASLLGSESGRQEEAQAELEQARALDPKLVAPSSTAAPTVASALANPKLKPLSKKFLLTRNSQVYEQPDQASHVVAEVRSKKFVNVTGITGDWLRIRLRSGTVGFIPVAAAE